jgi:hypothetical protein
MKVKMKSLMCGPTGNFYRDKEYDFPADEAKQLISGGFAEKVKQQAKTEIESATAGPPENTASRSRSKKVHASKEKSPGQDDSVEPDKQIELQREPSERSGSQEE